MAGVDRLAAHDAAMAIANELQAQHEGYRRYNERAIRTHFDNSASKLTRKTRRQNRATIKRAAVCAASVLGSGAVSDFAAGRSIILDGETLALDVARVASAARLGHSGLHVVAVDRTSKRKLADMCVYIEKTPALDQLTALALAMKAGEETHIIQTANLSNVTELGFAHPLIAERGKHNGERPWRPRDDRAEKNEAYWNETKPLWLNTLGVFVLGRQWEAMTV
jgi:hypothetical protein